MSLPRHTWRWHHDVHREGRTRYLLTMSAVANRHSQRFGIAFIAHGAAKAATREFWHGFPPAICEREQAALTLALSVAEPPGPSANSLRCQRRRNDKSVHKTPATDFSTCPSNIIAVARLVQFVVFFNLMKEIDHRRADLNLLVVFQKLLVERHVGRAAKRLGLTQSAASHALGRLRIMFGDPLFVRHPKGIEPTSRAHALAPIVVDILDRANSMLASPGWFDPSKPHTFTIGGTDLAVFTVLVPLIKRLRATAPKVDLRVRSLDSTRVVAAFDRQEIDCALMPFPEAPARITREPAIRRVLWESRAVDIWPSSVSESRPGIGRRSRTSWFHREEKIPVGQMSIWRSSDSNEGSSRWSRTSLPHR